MDRSTFPMRPRGALARGLITALVVGAIWPGAAAGGDFPFDHELLLDVRPLAGSKRLPSLEVSADGDAAIDLWCASGHGQVTVADQTISIVLGPMVERECTPDRIHGDDDLRAAYASVTSWHRDGESLVLVGDKPLRFRLATN